jgi:RNA polymerase sigma factor (sigma-70 family)
MQTDAVLVDRVIAGFDDGFDELYRRHANAAWRVAQAVAGNAHDAADAVSEAFARVLQAVKAGRLQDGDAFRSYLLAATRNSALDTIRRSGRSRPADDTELDGPADGASPADQLTGDEDVALVAEAFRNLPERWRSVLWLTEVEGIATKDAAEQLGLSANGTAQLAVRARAGLRDRYLQAHVRNHARPECRFTVDHLGAYVGGSIAPRDLAKVDQHLAGCEDCRDRKAELEDMGTTLRRIVLPLPLGLAAASALKAETALAAVTATATTGAGLAASSMGKVVQLAKDPTPGFRRVVGAAAAGVLALGVASLGFVDRGGDDPAKGLAMPRRAVISPVSAVLPDAYVPLAGTFDGSESARDGGFGDFGGSGSTGSGDATPTEVIDGGAVVVPVHDDPDGPDDTDDPDDPADPTCEVLELLCPTGPSSGPTIGIGLNLNGTPLGTEVTVDPTAPTETSIGLNVGGTEVLDGADTPTEPNTATITAPLLGTTTLP